MSSLRSVGSVVFVGLAMVLGLAGCRPGTALHSRYNNFRAYYNAYYNAERKLVEGEEALQSRNQKIDRGRLVELFPAGSGSGRGDAFQETVDKSAELLRERPDSKWADDALLLIGKAYFYQGNFVGAEQKFRETAEAAVVRDAPRLADEARLWLGRTYAATERYEDGVAVLQDALAQTDIDPRWQGQIQLALGELYGRAERWEEAADAIRSGIETVGDRELAARAYLLLGQVEEASGNWDEAAAAYALAARRAPAYELEYAARLNEALVLGLDAGRVEEALERIREMRRDDKNFQQRAEVELAWARIQAVSGDAPGARSRFRRVLYDETLAGGTVRGEAHYRLAEFYRDVEKNFVRASAHFDTAATALPATPDASVRLSRSAIQGARGDSETFTSVAATSRRIAEIDSLVALASLSEEEFSARIQEIEAERLRVFLEEQRQTNQLRANQAFSRGGQVDVASVSESEDVELQENVAGFLGHRNPATVQAGQIAFEQTWGDRPLVPDWRRRAAIEATALETATGSGAVATQARLPSGQGPPPLDLSVIPRTEEQRRQLDIELASLRYELANALFLSLARADSAVVLYRRILQETPDAPVAPRARYALAEVEYAAGRIEAAAPLFQDVIDADPESDLARAARIRLGQEEAVEQTVELPDASARTTERFAAARQQWSEGDPLGAMQAFVALGEDDPEGPLAPRAFLAGAAAYADFARGDSLLLVAALPDSLAPTLFRDTTALELAEDDTASAVTEAPAVAQPDAPDALPDTEADRPRVDDEIQVSDVEVEDGEGVLDADEAILRRRQLDDPPRAGDLDEDERKGGRLQDDDEVRRSQVPRPVEAPAPVAPEPVAPAPVVADSSDMVPPAIELEAEPDSATVPSVPSDSLRVESQLSDGELAAPVLGDSLLAEADGLAGPDSLAMPDSVLAPALPAFTLADYLDALIERYPASIEAQQAKTLRAALPQAAPPAEPEPQDDEESAPPETSQPEGDVATPEAPSPPVAAPVDLDANPYGTFGTQPLSPTVGGFTRRTNGLADAVEASVLVRQLVEEGFRAAVATDGVEVFVVVGQYPTDKALALASAELPAATLGAGTDIVRLEDIQLLPLVDGEDGQ